MREFFRGWRRKVGCATLVMACLVIALWIRSIYFVDELRLFCGNVCSRNQSLELEPANWDLEFWASQKWVTYSTDGQPSGYDADTDPHDPNHIVWYLHMLGIGIGKWPDGWLLTIPYWSVVVPLTLLSAFLILSKPRRKKTAESAPTPGA
jgi:hypothetical protein